MWIFQNFGLARWSDLITGWVGGDVGATVQASASSPGHCTHFGTFLPTYFFTLRCSKPKLLAKNHRVGKKLPECSQKFFTEVTKGCLWLEFLRAECFDQSIWCLVEEKPHCKGTKSSHLPVPNLCRDTQSRLPGGTGTSSRFLQSILPTPSTPCTGNSWPRGRICVSVFYSPQWTFLPQTGLSFPVVFLAPVRSDGKGSHSVAVCSVEKCVCVFYPISSSLHILQSEKQRRNILVLPFPNHSGHAVTLELLVLCLVQTKGFPSPESYFCPICIEAELLQFSCCKIEVVGMFILILFILTHILYSI